MSEQANPLRGNHDDASRKVITDACTAIAKMLLERELHGTHWRVEVDGWVFKFDVKGYQKGKKSP